MAEKWTPEQQAAISARKADLLVSASAGSGKTAVLVERIIRLIIEDRVPLSAILAVTFTRAAASEMKKKIREAIEKALLAETDSEVRSFLRGELSALPDAAISTIDSFCLNVVRAEFQYTDLDPDFRTAQDAESRMLLDEAYEEVLEEAYAAADPGFLDLSDRFGGTRVDGDLKDVVLKLHGFLAALAEPEEWLREKINIFDKEDDLEARRDERWLLQLQRLSRAMDDLAAFAASHDGPNPYADVLETEASELRAVLSSSDPKTALPGFVFASRLPGARGDVPGKKAATEMRKAFKDEVKDLLATADEPLDIEDNRALKKALTALGDLVLALDARFGEKKRDKRVVDFSDMERYCKRLLDHEDIALKYRNRFRYGFVDEYQDSNSLQEAILSKIIQPGGLFMVGDVKQSIYGFRHADPSLFEAKYRTFGKTKGAKKRRIDLNRNFRSARGVTEAVNCVFRDLMCESRGNVRYAGEAELIKGRPDLPDDTIKAEVLLTTAGKSQKKEKEADALADYILSLVGKQKIYDAKRDEMRPVEFGDIAILMRTTRSMAPVMEKRLLEKGVPVYFDGGEGYLESPEIALFLDLLRLIDNRRRDVELLSVLRTPLFGFDEKDLAEIRLIDKNCAFSEAALLTAAGDTPLGDRLRKFFEQLSRFAVESRYRRLPDYLMLVMEESGYYDYAGTLPLGKMRQDNLRLLTHYAGEYEGTGGRGLYGFLRYISRVKRSGGDMGQAKALPEGSGVVRMMSIHKSKGLQFPVTIVAGLGGDLFPRQTNAENILFHKDLGFALKYIDMDKQIQHDTLSQKLFRTARREEELAEEIRLLYVAMTRAESMLILSGTVYSEETLDKFKPGHSDFSVYDATTRLDLLLPCVLGEEGRKAFAVKIKLAQLNDTEEATLGSEEFLKLLAEKAAEQDESDAAVQAAMAETYSHPLGTRIGQKLAVTEIVRARRGQEAAAPTPESPRRPRFMQAAEENLTAAELGDLYHLFFRNADLKRTETTEDILEQIDSMEKLGFFGPAEAEALRNGAGKLLGFFVSDLGQRLKASGFILREKPFLLSFALKDYFPDAAEEEDRFYVQGIIDCVFLEEDGAVLIDFKTGRVLYDGTLSEEARLQLGFYARAVEKIWKKPVKASYVYSLQKGTAYRVL